jgi:hypothetical protein
MFKKAKTIAVLTFLVWTAEMSFAGEIIYVDADSPGPGYDGRSWFTAYKYLQDALLGPVFIGDQILVAEGSYKPDQGTWVTPGDRNVSFDLVDGVVMKGGYAGFGQPNPDERDIYKYETMLSGDLNSDDGTNFINYDENSHHVVTCDSLSAATVLDGFTITGGNANIHYDPKHRGGGIFNDTSDTTIINCKISKNYAITDSGGMYNSAHGPSSNPTLIGCIFSGNQTPGRGGGIHNYDGNPTLINCTFVYNHGTYRGGGMNNEIGYPIMINCIFWGNVPDGIYDSLSKATVSYCDVQNGWTGLGNIDIDPCFADPCNGDYHLQSEAGRWDPSQNQWIIDANTSRCIDAGNPGSVVSGESQPNGDRINMGAHGGSTQASRSPGGWGLLADLDNNGIVNFEDYVGLAIDWFDNDDGLPGDLDRDGTIDTSDLSLFVKDWLIETVWYEP